MIGLVIAVKIVTFFLVGILIWEFLECLNLYAISTFIQLNLHMKKFVGYIDPDPSKHKFSHFHEWLFLLGLDC